MSKRVKIGVGLATLVLAGSIVTTALAGGTAEPGSLNDPIVTKSYVDEQINLMSQKLSKSSAGTVIEVVQLQAGDILLAKAGTEFIVRNGTTIAHGENSNGIPDVTGGVDIAIGKEIPLNHLLIFPREDGRGIKASPSTKGTIYVMVRGGYEITKAK